MASAIITNKVQPVLSASERSRAKYQDLWNTMVIHPHRVQEVIREAQRIIKYRKRFEIVVEHSGGSIPWYFLGMIYYREDGLTFKGHVHNGDSLRARTYRVPKGRPITVPQSKSGYSFEESAFDLIKFKGYDKVKSWSLETLLYYMESMNGFGYVRKGINSPYLWSYTNHYSKGLYVADHKYDPNVVSKQIGCAPLLRYLTDKTLGLL